MTLKRVVLPDPLGPITPNISPSIISKSTSQRAIKPPKDLFNLATFRKDFFEKSFIVTTSPLTDENSNPPTSL
jgi:hypothetical protein